MIILLAAVVLVSLTLPVMAQECELYIAVQQRCFPMVVLRGALISAKNQAGEQVFSDITNIQGNQRIVVPGNEEYTIQVDANGYSPETKKARNLCLQVAPLLTFFLFPAGVNSCPPMVLPTRQPGSPNG